MSTFGSFMGLLMSRGTMVKYYKQADDIRVGRCDQTQAGACYAISVRWLASKMTGGDFWEWYAGLEQQDFNNGVGIAHLLQGKHRELQTKGDNNYVTFMQDDFDVQTEDKEKSTTFLLHALTGKKLTYKGRAMRGAEDRQQCAERSFEEMNTKVGATERIWYFLVEWGGYCTRNRKNVAHTTGVQWLGNGNVIYMDPNLGEYKFTQPNRFQAFLCKHYESLYENVLMSSLRVIAWNV